MCGSERVAGDPADGATQAACNRSRATAPYLTARAFGRDEFEQNLEALRIGDIWNGRPNLIVDLDTPLFDAERTKIANDGFNALFCDRRSVSSPFSK
jgi:hypothetical protein